GVAAVARTVGPDLAVLGEVGDVLGVAAGPRHVGLALGQRRAHRVQGLHERLVGAQLVQGGLAHAGHHAHRDHDVLGVGDLHAQLGVLGAEWAHAERHHVHGAALHRAAVQLGHGGAHLGGVDPVV